MVTIETDDELIIALKEMKGPVYKFSIVVLDDEKNREGHTCKKRPNKRLRGIKSKEYRGERQRERETHTHTQKDKLSFLVLEDNKKNREGHTGKKRGKNSISKTESKEWREMN